MTRDEIKGLCRKACDLVHQHSGILADNNPYVFFVEDLIDMLAKESGLDQEDYESIWDEVIFEDLKSGE